MSPRSNINPTYWQKAGSKSPGIYALPPSEGGISEFELIQWSWDNNRTWEGDSLTSEVQNRPAAKTLNLPILSGDKEGSLAPKYICELCIGSEVCSSQTGLSGIKSNALSG